MVALKGNIQKMKTAKNQAVKNLQVQVQFSKKVGFMVPKKTKKYIKTTNKCK